MRLTLKDFQADTVDELTEKLRRAAREAAETGDLQAICLSSPTGSGEDCDGHGRLGKTPGGRRRESTPF